ncbi:amidase signature domain-containing protein [Amanita rubescens]|nr:amidase signature domain-containing protein [Amanita rubescens]
MHGRLRVPSRRLIHDWRKVIAEKNPSVNAFVCTTPENGRPGGPLSGVGIAIKDNICTADMPTTCSSKMLKDFTPPFDATVVQLLRQAGADILGKTNCDEFGMGSLNIHSVHGPVVNPLRFGDGMPRSAGGSSGGSAAAVAAGMCFAALGTDTGGSTRLPAAYCEIVGLKPSYGLLSRWGVVSFADSLDCVGIFAAKVEDAEKVFDILNVFDDKDPTAAPEEVRRRADIDARERMSIWDESGSLHGLRIGIPQEYFPAELSPEIRERVRVVVSRLQAKGATVVPVSLPSTSYALSAYYVLASAEASSNMARYDGVEYGNQERTPAGADLTRAGRVYAHTRTAGFGREVQKRVLLGTYGLTASAYDNYFLQAQRVRELVKADFERVFILSNHLHGRRGVNNGVDVVIHASGIGEAPLLGDERGLETYVEDVLTVPASLAGLPAVSIGGVSVVGQWGSEALVMRVGVMT